jgi:sulfur carrier protein
MVTINGKTQDAAGKTVLAYLEEAGYDARRIVVERNEEILAKTEFNHTLLQDGDVIEIVCFMGGGC